MSDEGQQEYDQTFVDVLELVWGEGYLSPGGADEVVAVIGDVSLSGGASGGDVIFCVVLGGYVYTRSSRLVANTSTWLPSVTSRNAGSAILFSRILAPSLCGATIRAI